MFVWGREGVTAHLPPSSAAFEILENIYSEDCRTAQVNWRTKCAAVQEKSHDSSSTREIKRVSCV